MHPTTLLSAIVTYKIRLHLYSESSLRNTTSAAKAALTMELNTPSSCITAYTGRPFSMTSALAYAAVRDFSVGAVLGSSAFSSCRCARMRIPLPCRFIAGLHLLPTSFSVRVLSRNPPGVRLNRARLIARSARVVSSIAALHILFILSVVAHARSTRLASRRLYTRLLCFTRVTGLNPQVTRLARSSARLAFLLFFAYGVNITVTSLSVPGHLLCRLYHVFVKEGTL